MAAFSMSTFVKESDEFKDFCCSTCEEQLIMVVADFYCEKCSKFYCRKCIYHHGQLFKKHSPYGRGEIRKWPVSKTVEDFLEKCEVHKDEKLKIFCNDHSQLCCANCAFLNHSQCTKVTLISESVKNQSTDMQQLSAKLQTIMEEMKSLQNGQEASIQSLQVSCDEYERNLLEKMDRDIKNEFDNITVGKTYENEQNMKEEMCRKIISILDELDSNVQEMMDELISLKDSLNSAIHNCIGLQDEFKRLHEAMQKIGDNKELSFIASKKCLHKIQQALTVLGKSDQLLTVKGKLEYNVKILSDSHECFICAICVLPDGQILLADWRNNKVKLLDQQYQVVSDCRVSTYPQDMCQITSSKVAVTVDSEKTHEVQFISVNNGQLVKGRKLQLQHACKGIAIDQGDLYVTSGTALYKYTLSGKQVSKLYEDTSDLYTVWKCAVSPTGKYIINWAHHKLLTLARDGSVLATFIDPELRGSEAVHVTSAGQLLFCGFWSNTVIQVDSEGRKKLSTLATDKDGVRAPISVCYNRHTSSIIVGRNLNNNILVFEVQ